MKSSAGSGAFVASLLIFDASLAAPDSECWSYRSRTFYDIFKVKISSSRLWRKARH